MVQYLVKWMDLTYADATWEDEDEDIPDLLNYIRDYEDLRLVYNYDIGEIYQLLSDGAFLVN